MESCRRGLLNDIAEHRFILKNNQNNYYPLFSFAYYSYTYLIPLYFYTQNR